MTSWYKILEGNINQVLLWIILTRVHMNDLGNATHWQACVCVCVCVFVFSLVVFHCICYNLYMWIHDVMKILWKSAHVCLARFITLEIICDIYCESIHSSSLFPQGVMLHQYDSYMFWLSSQHNVSVLFQDICGFCGWRVMKLMCICSFMMMCLGSFMMS